MGKARATMSVIALAWAVPSAAQTGIVKWRTSRVPEARGAALLRLTLLGGHNAARVAAGVPPLTWSDSLAEDASRYAAAMAWSGHFDHSPMPRGTPTQGENLWMGTRGAFRYDEMLASWGDERRLFRDAPVPHFAVNGRWQDVAHYTQMIWGRTREVGCALAAGRTAEYLVCRYLPAGNVIGQLTLDTDRARPARRLAMQDRR